MTAREIILDLLVRDSAPCDTQCGVLEHGQRAAILHVLNGGHLDVSVGTDRESVAADHHGGGKPVVLLSGDDTECATAGTFDATKTEEVRR